MPPSSAPSSVPCLPPAARTGVRALAVALLTVVLTIVPAYASDDTAVTLTLVGADAPGPQAGPDTYQWGSTLVVAHQAGRYADVGAAGVVAAASADGGTSWTSGLLPGLIGGPYQRVSDPSVAYDARHGVWLVTTLALSGDGTGAAVLTSRSVDGGLNWERPVVTAAADRADLDKSWVVCDNGERSPYLGRCYAVFDDHAAGNSIMVARSSDGGVTWEVAPTSATGLGGQPVVRPDGAVVVPYLGDDGYVRAFRSRDGGGTWGASVAVARVERHPVAGGLRAEPLPSAEADASGTVYVAWHDCRFQYGCAGNDIVLSRSGTGASWSDPVRVTSGGGDHFIPGLGVDRESGGEQAARLALTYYRYPEAACTAATCRLTVAYTSSVDGGAGWSPPLELHGPVELDRLAAAGAGLTVGDYISTSVLPGGRAFPAFAVAAPPPDVVGEVRTHTVAGGLPLVGGGPATVSVDAAVATGDPAAGPPATSR
ncbi:sialidase family protein [Nonomuraea maritima]|uniref:sialidase family protein n=1 Tax=Nonomuraea maritima TaxID=683260 RepID=UPI00372145F6